VNTAPDVFIFFVTYKWA